ncbi:MAG: DUF2461 domain-containing protein [Flavobacteriaceae bacterium]|nr:DUF2461 domain-containing protein [Flavobacteriaceae bacterium]
MHFFSEEYLNFFKELAANNHKDWFDSNRKRYEENVKSPFHLFVSELITAVSQVDSDIHIEAKDAIFRINRDIRFSKDKTPYKLFSSAIVSKYGKADKSYPGMYLEMGPEAFTIYGGVYMPAKEEIEKIRREIHDNLQAFNQIIEEDKFKSMFGTVQGDRFKKVPPTFAETFKLQPLVLNKQWYHFATLEPRTILRSDLMEITLEHFKVALPFQNFMNKALNNS